MKNRMLIVFLFTIFGVSTAYANTQAQREISTAITHASLAEKMTKVNQVDLHLHHVINCLVGTKGVGFDAKAGDPCLGMGNGAINDYKGDKVNRDMLKQALQDAQYGLMTKRVNIARNAADMAEKRLQESREGL